MEDMEIFEGIEILKAAVHDRANTQHFKMEDVPTSSFHLTHQEWKGSKMFKHDVHGYIEAIHFMKREVDQHNGMWVYHENRVDEINKQKLAEEKDIAEALQFFVGCAYAEGELSSRAEYARAVLEKAIEELLRYRRGVI